MMKTANIKDWLILLCIHPEKGWVRKRSIIVYALIAAALFDLVLQRKLRIVSGRIETQSDETNDPLFRELMRKLSASNEKRFSWLMTGISVNPGKYYRTQISYLESSNLLSITPVEWMGLNLGKRYRVSRADSLKPLINQLDRVLIYGRKPTLELRLLIELLGSLNVLGKFFPDGELRKRANSRLKAIASQPYPEHDETLYAIGKELRTSLRLSKMSYGKSY